MNWPSTWQASGSCSCWTTWSSSSSQQPRSPGRTGTVTFSERGAVNLAGIITVHRKIIDATGDLEGLRGTIDASDPIAAPVQRYTGRDSFGNAK